MNPLFPDEDNHQPDKNSYILPNAKGKKVMPISKREKSASPAVELIRTKIDALYASEPNSKEEMTEAAATDQPRSKHQQFMYELSTSGKSLAQIQAEWHDYYAHLSDSEKHEVWQEFYAANQRKSSSFSGFVKRHAAHQVKGMYLSDLPPVQPHGKQATKTSVFVSKLPDLSGANPSLPNKQKRSPANIRKQIIARVRAANSAQLKAKQHLQSLFFGLGAGAIALLIFLFSFFNEAIIAPLIQPTSKASATPIILTSETVAPSQSPELIIPKINVQLPVVYGLTGLDEKVIQTGLEDGIIHYPSTATPGQRGNAAFFGHSSNNIFNKGRYKFAFVLLHELVPGDIFYLTYQGKAYSYRVYEKRIVNPDETWVLNPVAGKTATAALITCDPPGTSLRRLVVWGEQITPDPNANAAAPEAVDTSAIELPNDGPTLWARLRGWVNPFD